MSKSRDYEQLYKGTNRPSSQACPARKECPPMDWRRPNNSYPDRHVWWCRLCLKHVHPDKHGVCRKCKWYVQDWDYEEAKKHGYIRKDGDVVYSSNESYYARS